MLAYMVRRLLVFVPTIFVLITLSFFVIRLAPGGPFDEERALPPSIKANLETAYGLNKPIFEQYLQYLKQAAHGELGLSVKYRDFPVSELILAGLPISLKIGSLALLFAFVIGAALGVSAVLGRYKLLDTAINLFSTFALALPTFIVGPLLILVFCLYLNWIPITGLANGSATSLILPVATLSLPLIAVITRLTRTGLLEALNTPYVKAARARGLSELRIITHHALRQALLPTISYLGTAATFVFAGSLVVESLFNLPGVGRLLVQGALNRDYPVIMGMVIVYGSLTMLCNLGADILRAWLDPRVRYD